MGSNEKCMVPLEVLAVYDKKLREATIAVQDRLFLQTKEVIEGESFVRSLARKNLMQEQPNQIREAMIKGYVEMSHINLMIASECLHAEYEAQHMVERLVSGDDTLNVKRGDVFFADLSPVVGSEQGGTRPVLIIQNDIGNRFSPTVIIAAITAQIQKAKLPTHVEINAEKYGFERDSVILLEQVRTIDKSRLTDRITQLDHAVMEKVDGALMISLGLVKF